MTNREEFEKVQNQMNLAFDFEQGDKIGFTHCPNGLGEPNVIATNMRTDKETFLFIDGGEVYLVVDLENNDTEYVCDVKLFEIIYETFEEINQCPECDGEGYQDYGPVCSKPVSMCCGGCYERRECECDDYKPFR